MISRQVPKDLHSWLTHIEQLHPKSIAMGLDRVQRVIQRLKLQPNFKIITVAGTNGKGSTCAMLAQIYQQAGYLVGCYTSPHLLRYNERVKVNGIEAADEALCRAFEAIDDVRQSGPESDEVPLTYFEVGTLAALWHFVRAGVDVAILEIGLGGRLDAVNAFEPDCAVVTSVDLDHQEFLGDTREKIGFEKAGVFRKNKPAICGDENPPESLMGYALKIQADLKCINRDFGWIASHAQWEFLLKGKPLYTLPLPALKGIYQLNNASCAVAAVYALQDKLPVNQAAIEVAMCQVTVTGRFQLVSNKPFIILDVAHNPHAARALAQNLHALEASAGKKFAVFAMLADKDIKGVVEAVKQEIDAWYVASVDHVRGAAAVDLHALIKEMMPQAQIRVFDTAAEACKQACMDVNENDKIIAFGSFFTVASVMQYLNERAYPHL